MNLPRELIQLILSKECGCSGKNCIHSLNVTNQCDICRKRYCQTCKKCAPIIYNAIVCLKCSERVETDYRGRLLAINGNYVFCDHPVHRDEDGLITGCEDEGCQNYIVDYDYY